MDLTTLITGAGSVTGQAGELTNGVLTAAINKMMEEKKEKLILSAAQLVQGFVKSANQLRSEAQEAQKKADAAKESADAATKALAYFQHSGIPLPFYAATFNREAGVRWCRENDLEVPAPNSDLWKVPASFIGGSV